QRDVVGDGGIAWVSGLCVGELLPRPAQVAAQEIRVADVVDDFGPRPEDRKRLGIGTVGEFVAFQPVIGSRKPEPGFAVARRLLRRAAEMLFGQAVVLLAI